MCEIYGFCGDVPVKLNKYTNEFWAHSRVHRDGFGYYLQDYNDLYVNPDSAEFHLSDLRRKDFTSKLALCHIRFKTHGKASLENCHPFIATDIHGIKWTLIHNGFIEDTDYMYTLGEFQKGKTDSERILLYIIEAVNFFYEHTWIEDFNEMIKALYVELESTLREISLLGKVNLIFTDSLTNNMYVYKNSQSLYYLETSNGIHISTTKLSDEAWNPLALNKLYIFNNGKIISH